MFILIIAILLFFCVFILIDKEKNKQNSPIPQKKNPTTKLSLDQKIKLEKAESMQQVTSKIRQIEKQTIKNLLSVLNHLKENTKS
ncbi:hypothetical protein UAW_02925 [Enterococcus haemoperoxidus ATCC BAA-382]|uniref:Uncharacterized protein n=1 Tax=Enterococcus haemoperoxidus ATCC BAA-382 TaxID=1158608 RepID=R2SY16_9ENTE|nr:hypothetical protein [Enterococcus haemoperoxidus]EOH92884.1 hypothetical protein UAW_02925 [Enterococcus haemoperoxidus ATCC BAA-382]EOT61627.1 hypothetical protein I583_00609 [Enterococcus haemoperoxidus ATCC BAA-382]OJG55460.1 hypothetical protein RV06_GL001903 [Enterococcus haemoperoxidus]